MPKTRDRIRVRYPDLDFPDQKIEGLLRQIGLDTAGMPVAVIECLHRRDSWRAVPADTIEFVMPEKAKEG